MKERILVTGSEGLIGGILIPYLENLYEVFSLDIKFSRRDTHFIADISNLDQLISIFQKLGGVNCIIHLAADSRVDADWDSILKNNIVGTRNIYECAKEFAVSRVIFASSNHVTGGYEGIPPNLHTKENPSLIMASDPIRPDGYYGVSKEFGEATARQFYELYEIQSICLRIGTVLADNDPTKDETKRSMKTWLSHRDLVQLILKGMQSDIQFGIYYGVSNNKGRFWDISNAKRELGYQPQDDASSLI
ncbi:NAD(P)-dependent oxidoreductase [Candidatus Microgenomates bacterium]|nr:NAD(P)-dependent oxidoreductase [Candidatus Microgenomates bacterium]